MNESIDHTSIQNMQLGQSEEFLIFSNPFGWIDWLFLGVIAGILLFLTFWNIYKTRTSWFRVGITIVLRLLGIALLYFIFLQPTILTREVHKAAMEFPIFFDHSYSMNNVAKNQSEPLQKKYMHTLFSQMQPENGWDSLWESHPYIFNQASLPFKWEDLPFNASSDAIADQPEEPPILPSPQGIFHWNDFMQLINNQAFAYPIAVLVSDQTFLLPPEINAETPTTPLFIVKPFLPIGDFWVMDAAYKNGEAQVTVQNNESQSLTMTCSMYHNTILLDTQEKSIEPGIQTLSFPIAKDTDTSKTYAIHFESALQAANPLNKWAYVTVPPVEETEPVIHFLLGAPTYDSGFITRFLRNRPDFDFHFYSVKSHRGFRLPNSFSEKDRVFLYNVKPNQLSQHQRTMIQEFVEAGGILIYFTGDSSESILGSHTLQGIHGCQRYNKTGESTVGPESIKPTSLGMNQDFLSFRDPYAAREIWDSIRTFYAPHARLTLQSDTKICATMQQLPCIYTHSVGDGEVVMILVSGIWKMDFSNLAYGITSGYLKKWVDELLVHGTSKKTLKGVFELENPILGINEETRIFINPRNTSETKLNIVPLYNAPYEIPLQKDPDSSLLYATLSSETPDQLSIYLGDELVTCAYITYPADENKAEPNPDTIKQLKTWCETSGGNYLEGEFAAIQDYLKKYEKNKLIQEKNALFDVYPTLLYWICIAILLLLVIDWLLRRFFWR